MSLSFIQLHVKKMEVHVNKQLVSSEQTSFNEACASIYQTPLNPSEMFSAIQNY